jgi:oligopeptide/dipeptide ABC transporter ATP-binding protein
MPAPSPDAVTRAADPKGGPLLSVRGLRVSFEGRLGRAVAVDDVSFDLQSGETLAIVGESGSGKTVTALSILRLIPSPPGQIEQGTISFEGQDVLGLDRRRLHALRGDRISMIFQEPMTSLNPVLTVGRQLTEGMIQHRGLSPAEARQRAVEMLRLVRIPEPEVRFGEYPHRLSGGMRQRVMIAMAIACSPRLIIADEPTTALDVSIQAQILDLLAELKERLGTAIIFITHDLGIVAEMADRVAVMYAGRIVEEAPVTRLFDAPLHPYTRGLLDAVPHLDRLMAGAAERAPLTELPGLVPSIYRMPPGCSFAPRCAFATDHCRAEKPALEEKRPGQRVACWETARVAGS